MTKIERYKHGYTILSMLYTAMLCLINEVKTKMFIINAKLIYMIFISNEKMISFAFVSPHNL